MHRRPVSEVLPVLVGQRFGPAAAVADNVKGLSGCEQLARRVVRHLVRKADRAPLELRDAGANPQRVVVAGRAAVATARFGDDDAAVVLNFHLLVLHAALPHVSTRPTSKYV